MTRCLSIEAREETWPLKQPFRIARGTRTEARVVVVTVTDGQHSGRGEGTPLKRYNQNTASVLAQIEPIKIEKNLDRQKVQQLLSAGAARNALDCALWDLEAKRSGKRVWELANAPIVPAVETSLTISLDSPAAMAGEARAKSDAPILKLKLGGDNLDLPRVEAVREAAPVARLLIDANESWSPDHYRKVTPLLGQLGIELIEQPFPATADEILETLDHPIPVCADESCHTSADLPRLKNRYEVLNVKLDKTGGLTEGLLLTEAARESGFKLLIGCMLCTSLGIAPARLLPSAVDYVAEPGMPGSYLKRKDDPVPPRPEQVAGRPSQLIQLAAHSGTAWVDLDGPLLLTRDRDHGLSYHAGSIGLPTRELWG